MALQDMRDFVAHHASEFRLALGSQQRAGIHADEAAHHRECVNRIFLDHEEFEIAARRIAGQGELAAEAGDVVGQFRVLHEGTVGSDRHHDALADDAFLRFRQRGVRGIAEIGQAGLRAHRSGEERRGEQGGGKAFQRMHGFLNDAER